jgi:hypothetical protein
MGSGSYLGGSTVVNVGWAWSPGSRTNKKNFNTLSGYILDRSRSRVTLLRKIIEVEIKIGLGVNFTKKEKLAFENEIKQKGGMLKWAKFQPEYELIKKEELFKKKEEERIKQRLIKRKERKRQTLLEIKKTSNKKINTRKQITLPAFKSALAYELQQALGNKK